MTRQKLIVYGIVGGVGLILVWLAKRGAAGVGLDLGKATGNAVGGVATGVVVGIGETLGIPATDSGMCEIACKEGRTLDASAYCTASRFIKYATTGK